MADSDKPASAPPAEAPLSAQRRRTARARAEREVRLAASLRANIARRKEQARGRSVDDPADPETDGDPVSR